jgi:hypothetical protein
MTNKTTRTNEEIFMEFDGKFVIKCSDGFLIKDVEPKLIKQFIANIRKQDQEDLVRGILSVGIMDAVDKSGEHSKKYLDGYAQGWNERVRLLNETIKNLQIIKK